MSSSQIKRYSGDYGNRWYLNDRPIYVGSTLEAQMATGDWMPCRFEGPIDAPKLYDLLSVPVSAANVTLRWPPKEDRSGEEVGNDSSRRDVR